MIFSAVTSVSLNAADKVRRCKKVYIIIPQVMMIITINAMEPICCTILFMCFTCIYFIITVKISHKRNEESCYNDGDEDGKTDHMF